MLHRQLVASLVLMVAILVAAVSARPQTVWFVIRRVNIVDVTNGRTLPNRTVRVQGQTIASVSEGDRPSAESNVFDIDGDGLFLMPGLWDMHAHMEATGSSSLQLYVANGVTGIRDMGSALDLILAMRDDTASGRVLGPRIFAAGPILDDAPGDWPFRMRVKTAEEGRAAVQLLKRRGVDLIKVHDHTPREAFLAIADEARRQNLPLAGHVPQGVTVQQAIDAGQQDIEHLQNSQLWRPCSGGAAYSAEPCRPFFDMLARRVIWQTPTIAASREIATIGTSASAVSTDQLAYASRTLKAIWAGNQGITNPDVVRAFRATADVAAAVTKDLASAGVPILAGCDAMIAGFCIPDELQAMVRGGMTPSAALHTATTNPVKYFGLQQTTGSVAMGQRADLVLLDANPLTDIANVRRIRAVVLAGRYLDRTELDTLLEQVKVAASQQ